ncbi:hypothetical protein B0A48_08634 [Cryoendolithus antarcticus]|uniref:Uncharacterized protein n=1 Tax=Cryoendolithus antarcticus TaxID=1507870 RepID=A0A1V8T3R0_9PEZI|nr:hypothetical protein B0A48_08634 [Cryoendolithus antarcticus]OQO15990.1 hypothetical protein B0A51_18130 [Rachicladosporium sp. CCFEE 5018]
MSFRSPAALLGLLNLGAIGSATYYLKSLHDYNLEEFEARQNELDQTLRGHIGIIEDSLVRIEGKKLPEMSEKSRAHYEAGGKLGQNHDRS